MFGLSYKMLKRTEIEEHIVDLILDYLYLRSQTKGSGRNIG